MIDVNDLQNEGQNATIELARRCREAENLLVTYQREQQTMQDDLAALLRALDMGDHARPQSPHEVMLEAVARARAARQALQEWLAGHGGYGETVHAARRAVRELVEELEAAETREHRQHVRAQCSDQECFILIGERDEATGRAERAESALAEAQAEIEEWQDASGLCVPAEEHGGDPGGVRPEHLRAARQEDERILEAKSATFALAMSEVADLRDQVRVLREALRSAGDRLMWLAAFPFSAEDKATAASWAEQARFAAALADEKGGSR